jgi:hypothetical protein
MRKLLFALAAGLALWAAPAGAVVTTTVMPNAAYTASITDQRIITSAPFTASRTLTLPAAAGTCIGQTCPPFGLEIFDAAGTVTATNTWVIAPATGDLINGSSSSLTFTTPNVKIIAVPISGTNWLVTATVNGVGVNPGTTIADNACTGCIGEFISSRTDQLINSSAAVVNGSVVTSAPLLTTTVPSNVTQVLLGAGDWDCRGATSFGGGTSNAAAATIFSLWTSTQGGTASPPAQGTNAGATLNHSYVSIQAASVTSPNWALATAPTRYSLAAATSVFLNTVATFSTGSPSIMGTLDCRRVR